MNKPDFFRHRAGDESLPLWLRIAFLAQAEATSNHVFDDGSTVTVEPSEAWYSADALARRFGKWDVAACDMKPRRAHEISRAIETAVSNGMLGPGSEVSRLVLPHDPGGATQILCGPSEDASGGSYLIDGATQNLCTPPGETHLGVATLSQVRALPVERGNPTEGASAAIAPPPATADRASRGGRPSTPTVSNDASATADRPQEGRPSVENARERDSAPAVRPGYVAPLGPPRTEGDGDPAGAAAAGLGASAATVDDAASATHDDGRAVTQPQPQDGSAARIGLRAEHDAFYAAGGHTTWVPADDLDAEDDKDEGGTSVRRLLDDHQTELEADLARAAGQLRAELEGCCDPDDEIEYRDLLSVVRGAELLGDFEAHDLVAEAVDQGWLIRAGTSFLLNLDAAA
ncbi:MULTISPECIES: hypothetical protein [Pseudonocardia]|uniref:Uncharacterized protein n=2 Tax=Pseudonocardia TaxID=1847 RepID=A0A1Y2N9H8_PSEAH|nr:MULTISPECIES: hypothetical protein [Pseudonocardia]OSY43558.1 hypothetical protein BG845_00501 [Pseudonocardia autotrophica]TDN73451.1 hypothetical protein C8E95_2548 [Pseudonocardia autotrophica]